MKRLTTIIGLALCVVFVPVSAAFAEQTAGEISWSKIQADGKITGGQVVSEDGLTYLKVVNTESRPVTVKILTIENPNVGAPGYEIVGQVRYEGVEAKGYLEMWNHFSHNRRFFSRTLGDRGPMKHLEGSCDWRRFVLPFQFNKDKSGPPDKLVVNIVLPGRGTVLVGPLRLVQYANGEDPPAATGVWWSDRTGGWLGGILGTGIGCLGGLIGLFGGRGKARRFVIGSLKVMFILGLAMLAVCAAALIKSQPYGVWYPFGLVGLLCTILSVAMLPSIRRRYEIIELRKMEAMDTA